MCVFSVFKHREKHRKRHRKIPEKYQKNTRKIPEKFRGISGMIPTLPRYKKNRIYEIYDLFVLIFLI